MLRRTITLRFTLVDDLPFPGKHSVQPVILDKQEVTGSNPVSPTSKPAGQRLVSRPAGFFVPAMCPPGPPFRARLAGRRGHVRGHSVETELVALDVLHHEARLVVAIGRQ